MNPLFSRCLFAAIAFSAAVFAGALDEKAALENQYARLCKAIVAGDSKTTTGMLAPSFTWVNPDGSVVTRSQFIAKERESEAAGMKFHEVSMKNDSYDIEGGTARVRSTSRIVVSMPEGKKRQKFLITTEGVDTWRKSPKGWMIYKVEVVNETFNPM
jgi:hypothetical protein